MSESPDIDTVLGSFHTCDLFCVNYCVNFSVHTISKNWYTTHYWTFQSTQKFTKQPVWMCPSVNTAHNSRNNSNLINRKCEWTLGSSHTCALLNHCDWSNYCDYNARNCSRIRLYKCNSWVNRRCDCTLNAQCKKWNWKKEFYWWYYYKELVKTNWKIS